MTFSPLNYATYRDASLWGIGQGALSLVLEQPFEVVKTRLQASPNQTSYEIALEIFQKNGWKGFYSGAIPHGFRLMLKQAYRLPLQVALPLFYEKELPSSLNQKIPTLAPFLSGVTLATLESGVWGPAERLKVYIITAKHGQLKYFFKENSGNIRYELFRGFNAFYATKLVSWVSFQVSNKKFKEIEKKRLDRDVLPFSSLLKVSFVVCLVNTLAVMPFDTVKTHLQKAEHLVSRGVFPTMHHIVRRHGVQALYAGWNVKIGQYMIQSTFTVPLLDHLEKKLKPH